MSGKQAAIFPVCLIWKICFRKFYHSLLQIWCNPSFQRHSFFSNAEICQAKDAMPFLRAKNSVECKCTEWIQVFSSLAGFYERFHLHRPTFAKTFASRIAKFSSGCGSHLSTWFGIVITCKNYCTSKAFHFFISCLC